jgi:hypothetical protein
MDRCAPAWDPNLGRNIGAYLEKPAPKKKNEDHFYDINIRNLIKISLRYRKNQGMKTKDLSEVLSDMCLHGYQFLFTNSEDWHPVDLLGRV